MKPYCDDQTSKPVAWVTGSSAPRVGRCIANHFAEKGYRIVVHSHSSTSEAENCAASLRSRNVESMVVVGPIESPDFAKNAVNQIITEFGRLDVLVNSAAVWDWRRLDEVSTSDILRQFEVNTLGTFLCCQAAGLQMVKQTFGGAIILIGDRAVQRPYVDFSPYFISKGTIETMTRSLAVELATRNPCVRVNAILPGTVLLDSKISPEPATAIHEGSLLKIPGKPEHIAEAAYFLAKHEFITGVALPVDGGRSIYSTDGRDANAHPTYAQRQFHS